MNKQGTTAKQQRFGSSHRVWKSKEAEFMSMCIDSEKSRRGEKR